MSVWITIEMRSFGTYISTVNFFVHWMYLALINNGSVIRNTLIWKLKIPLKIKKIMWYMQKEVVLTKDNVVNESIQHLFYECYYAKILWGLYNVAFNITTPRNVCHMFDSWFNQFWGKLMRQALAGASDFCWAIWLNRNEVVFDKSPIQSLLQVLFLGTHWLRFWTPMEQLDQDKEALWMTC
jgi:hypothetical protein